MYTQFVPEMEQLDLIMRLAAWLVKSLVSDADFAREIGTGRVAVGRYKRGERMPETEIAHRIVVETEGSVSIQDLHDAHLEWLRSNSAFQSEEVRS